MDQVVKRKRLSASFKSKKGSETKRCVKYSIARRSNVSIQIDWGIEEAPPVPLEVKMELAKAMEDSKTMEIFYTDWKLFDNERSLLLPSSKNNTSHLPFVFFNPASNPKFHIFGDIEKKKSYCLKSSESHLELVHSKEGWLLFTTVHSDKKQDILKSFFDTKEIPSNLKTFDVRNLIRKTKFVLMNPTTGTQLKLPLLALKDQCKEYGAFTTMSNTNGEGSKPEQVIYVSVLNEKHRIFLTRPGDKCWKKYIVEGSQPSNLLLCGDKLYSLCTSYVLVFDLTDGSSHCYNLASNEKYFSDLYFKPLEWEGKVVMAGHPWYFRNPAVQHSSVPLYKLEICGDGKMVKWEELNDDELNGRVWFCGGIQSFCVKVDGWGRKVCWLQSEPLLYENVRVCGSAYCVHLYDMISGKRVRLTRDYFLCHEWDHDLSGGFPNWVDMRCHSNSNDGIVFDKLLQNHELVSFPDL